MADFVAVLKKTIDGLGETTPETRERVYSKARATIAAKLAALNPPPPPAVAERQKKALEDAITTIEAEYRAAEQPLSDSDEDLETAIAGLTIAQPIHPPYTAAPFAEPEPESAAREPEAWSPDDEEMAPLQPMRAPARKRNMAAIGAGLAVIALAGAGYAAWVNQDQIAGLFATAPETVVAAPEEPAAAPEEIVEPAPPAAKPAAEPETEVAAVAPQPEPSATEPEPAAVEPEPVAVEPEPAPADAAPEAIPVEKFTQRLRSDGTEIDEGPADGEPGIGEGTSIAAVTAAAVAAEPQSPPPLEAPQPSAATVPAGEPETPTQSLVAVGQKAIFYEERTNVAQGSAEDGSIIWSLVQESPGGDLPPEPAIRAEATIPGKDIQLRMTIRRNGDQTLPASHIVEMIFLTPDNFEGGGIDNVLRIALKESEQAAGNPLLGIPAKIADGFFLVALTDSPAEIQANTTMLRRQSWIDIPIVYRSGRRALITLEKGIPGDKVFDEALKAWQAASSG